VEAKHLGYKLNSNKEFETYPFFGDEKTIYFSSRGKIYKSKSTDGIYQQPDFIGDLFNSDYIDDCAEREYIIFHDDKRKGNYFHELYISFHKKNGSWSSAKYLGKKFHQGRRAVIAKVSFDKKHLFFVSNFSFYWVDTTIIKQLKKQVKVSN